VAVKGMGHTGGGGGAVLESDNIIGQSVGRFR